MEFEEWGDRWTTSFIGEVRCAGYADGSSGTNRMTTTCSQKSSF